MESQQVEWKESWRDEYLKWICGFANAQGGALHIGRNDKGEVVGLANPEKLLENIPNKIRHALGIVCDVNLTQENGKQYIAIAVQPHPYPVSYHGKHYIRSGSTIQELSGSALDGFMLRKQGKTWDGVPVPYVAFSDFESDSFKAFRRMAVESGRLTARDLQITDEMLLKNLRLTDGKYMTRAALLLFHQDPEQWVPGAYIKIGAFANGSDLLYQDEIHGSLITMADKVEDLVFTKYFKGIIRYDGFQRVEAFPVPRTAFREAILNAIVHKDYSTGNPIHIHIYPNEVLIYNDGQLPDTWSVSDLFERHTSVPHNPKIAGAFFRSGQIEAWGRGVQTITEACKQWELPEPFYRVRPKEVMIGFNTEEQFTDKFTDKFTVNETQKAILRLIYEAPKISLAAIAEQLGMTKRGIQKSIDALKEAGLIERVGPAKGGYWAVKQ